MRIFCAVRHSVDPRFYYGGLWSGNFYPALQQLGHEIVESQIDLLPASRFMHITGDFTYQEKEVRTEITRQIVDEVREAHRKKYINLFLSYFYNAHFDPAGFDEIHKIGIPTVNFYCNSIYQFDFVSEIAKKVNFSWHTEKNARQLYHEAGANPVWVQMGADPGIYHPIPGKMRQPRACFLGQRYADRDRWLAKLINSNVPVDIYGRGWDFKHKGESQETLIESQYVYLGRRQYIPGSFSSYMCLIRENIQRLGMLKGAQRTLKQFNYKKQSHKLAPLIAQAYRGVAKDLSDTFASYEVILNFSNVWADGYSGSKLIPHVRLRDFEAPMCRTCYLTGYTDEIAEFYELRREIDAYRTPEELVEKTKYYLTHTAEAEKMREAGYQRAIKDHTWKERFKTLFKKIVSPC